MRALVLTADYAPGAWSGIGSAAATQARALAGQGVDVEVLVPEEHPAAHSAGGSHVTLTPLGRKRFPSRAGTFDVVHLHSLALAGLAHELRRRYGLPLVYTAHASVDAELPLVARASGWAEVQETVLANSDRVVFPSAAERDVMLRRRPSLAARSSVVPNGVERPRGRVAEGRRGPVVFAGRFAVSKGLPLLARVVELLDGHPEIRFVVAGGHGDARFAARLRARRGCSVVGWLAPSRLDRLFRRASVVLVPSSYEPFGLVALEAMRAGAPVLAAAVGGLREVVTPGSGGVLVRSRDAEDWRDELVRLWGDPARRAELERRGPLHVARHYDPDELARTLVRDVYEPALEHAA